MANATSLRNIPLPSGRPNDGETIVYNSTKKVFEFGASGGGSGTSDHSDLSNLAYADSGHTGFQPAGSYLEDLTGLTTDDLDEGLTNLYFPGFSNLSTDYPGDTPWTGLGYLTGIICDSPLSGAGTSTSHLTVDLSSKQNALNGTGFVKISGTTISYDNSTYLTSVTAHNLLSTTHGDTTAGSCSRGDLITGQGVSPTWTRLAIGTTGKVLVSDGTDIGWSSSALGTAAYTASTDYATSGHNHSGVYQPLDAELTGIAALSYTSGTPFIKMTAAGTFALDTTTYLTSLSGAVLTDQSTPQTIGLTGSRLAMLWVSDITCTNAITGSVTGNAGTVTNGIYTTSQVTALAATAAGDKDKYLHSNSSTGALEWISSAGAAGATTALDNLASVAINTSLLLGTSDNGALGSTTKMWSDLFLADGSVINFNNGDVTLTHSLNTLTFGGGNLALGANSLTMTGYIAATGARVTKGWFTDIESTNMPTVGGTAILSSLTAPQFTTIELGHATDTTISRVSAGVIAVEGVTLRSGSLIYISETVASAAASVVFTGLSTAYRSYRIVFSDAYPSTNTQKLTIQVSVDNGANYKTGASDYSWAYGNLSGAAGNQDTTEAFFPFGNLNLENTNRASGYVEIGRCADSGYLTSFVGFMQTGTSASGYCMIAFAGKRNTAEANNALRVICTSGNINGTFTLYGII